MTKLSRLNPLKSRFNPVKTYRESKDVMKEEIKDYIEQTVEIETELAEHIAEETLKYRRKGKAKKYLAQTLFEKKYRTDEINSINSLEQDKQHELKNYVDEITGKVHKGKAVGKALAVPVTGGIIIGGVLYGTCVLLKSGDTSGVDAIHNIIIKNPDNIIINNATNVQITQLADTSMYNLDMTLEQLSEIVGTKLPDDTAINRAFEYGGHKIVAIGSDSIPLHTALDDTNPLILDNLYEVLRTTIDTSDVYVVGGKNPAIYAVVDGSPVWSEKITNEIFEKIYTAYTLDGSTDYELVKSSAGAIKTS